MAAKKRAFTRHTNSPDKTKLLHNIIDDSQANLNKEEIVEKSVLLDVDTSLLIPFSKHDFFPAYSTDEMEELKTSISTNGQVTPVLVRKHPTQTGKYEILSGHNRTEACRQLNIPVQVIVANVESDIHAEMIFFETNLKQRQFDQLAISNQAKIIAEYHRIVKQQGKRNDLLSEEDLAKEEKEKKAKAPKVYKFTKTQIAAYVRLDESLIDPLKLLVDQNKLSINSAYELSFISPDEQEHVKDFIETTNIKITGEKSKEIKALSNETYITTELISDIISRPKQSKPKITLPDQMVESLFKGMSKKEILETIEVAVKLFNKE